MVSLTSLTPITADDIAEGTIGWGERERRKVKRKRGKEGGT